jgi:gamma-glutamyl-gamma-aminobutyrate hydrolase PuuD
MGKRGNKARQTAKKHATLNENILNALAEDDHREAKQAAAEAVDPDPTQTALDREYQSSLEKIYGKRGPPTEDPFGRDIPQPRDNVVFLGMPKIPKRKVVDCLGRVVEVEDNIPAILRASNMPVKKEKSAVDKRRVTIMRDHELDYPELWMEVFVSPDPSVRDDEARFAQMFARSRCSRAKSVLEADLVVFAGGSDVDPALYGEEQHGSTCFNRARDDTDMMLYNLCVENGIPMLGVCRGAQFLHVMNGGKLYQDIDKHYGDHRMYVVDQKDFIDKVSSVHHQACIPQNENGFKLLGTNGDARNRRLNPSQSVLGARADVEAFFYRDTCCLGVQGHPEYQGYNRFTKWVLDQINSLILCSPDIEWRDGQRRVKLELLEERKLLAPKLIIPEENV